MINIGNVNKQGLESEHVMQKLAWQFVNLPIEVDNAFHNWAVLTFGANPAGVAEYRELLELAPGRVADMSDCPKADGPILLISSGSSADQVIVDLKKWDGPVMCSTSHLSTLLYYGRPPEYVSCLDPRVAVPNDELNSPRGYGDAVMLAHPSIPHEYIAQWLREGTGKIYVGRIMEPTYDWYTHHLATGYPWVRHVMQPMIDSGAGQMGMATWLGYNPLYLAGLDYGGPRFSRWAWDGTAWTGDEKTSGYVAGDEGNIGGMSYKQVMSYSSRGSLISAFMQIANQKWQQRIYQMSTTSVITELPHRPWADVLASPGADEWPAEQRAKVMEDIEVALAVWDTFLVPNEGGWGTNYQIYIAKDENSYASALMGYNQQLAANLRNFASTEKHFGKPIAELIKDGTARMEAGDLLHHAIEEFDDWDWHNIKPVNIGEVLRRRVWLLEEAAKRKYKAEDVSRALEIGRQIARELGMEEEDVEHDVPDPSVPA